MCRRLSFPRRVLSVSYCIVSNDQNLRKLLAWPNASQKSPPGTHCTSQPDPSSQPLYRVYCILSASTSGSVEQKSRLLPSRRYRPSSSTFIIARNACPSPLPVRYGWACLPAWHRLALRIDCSSDRTEPGSNGQCVRRVLNGTPRMRGLWATLEGKLHGCPSSHTHMPITAIPERQ